jgi:hypothetical protein
MSTILSLDNNDENATGSFGGLNLIFKLNAFFENSKNSRNASVSVEKLNISGNLFCMSAILPSRQTLGVTMSMSV